MDLANLDKLCTYQGGRLEWCSERFDNLIYLLSFEDGYYIGSTTNIRRRLAQYVADLTRNKYTNDLLQKAFNSNETFEVFCLEWVEDKARLTQREQFYIDIISPNLNKKTACSDKPKEAPKERVSTASLRVKEILKEKGQTQKDLAQKMGVAEISLSRSINGNPNLETLQKIADALEVEISELFTAKETDVITCPKCGSKFKLV